MAVAGIIETRAYFRKRATDNSEPYQPRKRQRVAAPLPEFLKPSPDHWPDNELPAPSPTPTLTSSLNPTASEVAHTALSASWNGPADPHYNDDEVFEDSNDLDGGDTWLEPIVSAVESESSDADSEDSDFESNVSETEEAPDIFDTNVDLNAAEHSE